MHLVCFVHLSRFDDYFYTKKKEKKTKVLVLIFSIGGYRNFLSTKAMVGNITCVVLKRMVCFNPTSEDFFFLTLGP